MKHLIAVMLLCWSTAQMGVAAEVAPRELARQIIGGFRTGLKTHATSSTNLAVLRDAAKEMPDDPSIHFALAICYMVQTNIVACAESMETAYATSKKDPEIGLLYALALKMSKQHLKAHAVNKELVAAHPEIPRLKISLAALDTTIQKYDEAIEVLESLLARAPANLASNDRGLLFFMLGTCRLYKGEHQKAIQLLEDANALAPNAAGILDVVGHAHLKGGNMEKAREYLDKALAINPNIPSTLYYKGLYFERMKLPEQAQKCFQDSYTFGKKRLNDNGQDYFRMAEVCVKLSKPDEAQEYRKQAAELLYTYDPPWR